MAQYNDFEDLPIWQDARVVAKEVYKLTQSSEFSRDYGLKDQIQRASVSVVSNIADEATTVRRWSMNEVNGPKRNVGRMVRVPSGQDRSQGFDYGSNKQFIRFLNIAKGSASEVRAQLVLAMDVGYISETKLNELKIKLKQLSRQIAGFIKYLESKNP